jgi:hypothetical protein
VLQSWLAYNDLEIKFNVNIAGEYDSPTLTNERVPSKEELDKILRMATPRARVSIALMGFSGLRPESLGNYTGSDGLRFGDLREVEIEKGKVELSYSPLIVNVRKDLSKSRCQYFTFLPLQGRIYLKDYLDERLDQGEKLDVLSPVLAFDPRGVKKNQFLRTTLVTRDIKSAILKAGFSWRPYVLRAYCDTNMIIAESKGSISHPYLQFIMGHKGDIEARYSTNKGILPPDMIEDMRQAYRRSQDFLQTIRPDAGDEKVRDAFKKELLAVSGFTEKELLKYDLSGMSNEELHEVVKRRLLGIIAKNGSRQKVIPTSEVERYLDDGWEYVTSLSHEQAIVKSQS